MSLLWRKGTKARPRLTSRVSNCVPGLTPCCRLRATARWLTRSVSIHCPRTMSDLLMLPASRRRSPDVWVCFVLSEPARSTNVSRDVCMQVGSYGAH